MKKTIILGMLFLAACASSETKKETLLPIKTMQQTVWQLMQVDEYLTRQIQTDTTIQPSLNKATYYQRVFNLNKVDRVQFYATMDYLDKHPVEMKELMDSVEALSKREKLALIQH
ncbi:MAG: hypothetical protein RIQ51_509 [Bacteroidota bacterium]|jgi:hypothetical protein